MCAETKTLSLDISLNAFPGSLIPLSSFNRKLFFWVDLGKEDPSQFSIP